MADIEKELIEAPELPNVVKGDGRYVMSQLRKFLKQMAIQVNLANGFTADEIQPSESGYAAPANFVLQFDATGGHFSWRDVTYIEELLYYELRTDDHVGSQSGLLERTTNNRSDVMPASSAGRVYLYAVLKDGTYSSGSVLSYNKARPEAPQDIAMTRNEQGILITYTYVPLDCIGAHIYINGVMYETDDNLFLYTGDTESVSRIEVAYYDNFGDGERGYLNLIIPNVENFIVERNGAMLDFQWDSVDVYNVAYVVKVANVPVWDTGVELFRTTRTKNKIEYPNAGDIYFLIKAYDPHGVYSSDAAWYLLTTVDDASRNHIVDFDQYETRYSGNKINMYYDDRAGGLRLTDDAFTGEYVFKGTLPQRYRARNWHEEQVSSVENSDIRVVDLDFSIVDEESLYTTCVGGVIGNVDSVELRAQISRFTGADSEDVFLIPLNGSLETISGEEPTDSQQADTYDYGRYDLGLVVNDLTRLKYAFKNQSETFGFIFHIKVLNLPKRCIFAKISYDVTSVAVKNMDYPLTDDTCAQPVKTYSASNGWLEIGYDGAFYAEDSNGNRLELDASVRSPDWLSFGLSQDSSTRTLFLKNMNVLPTDHSGFEESVFQSSANYGPLGVPTAVQFYK